MSAAGSPGTIRLGPRQRLTVISSDPAALELECTWAPGDPPPTHWHPSQHEHFEVLEGELTVLVDGDRRLLRTGDVLDLPPRTAHGMWNAGPNLCRASWRVTPAQRTEEMFRFLASDPGALAKASLVWRFRHELRLGRPRG
jgi:quercetin dioxygenase-like cupin family protein